MCCVRVVRNTLAPVRYCTILTAGTTIVQPVARSYSKAVQNTIQPNQDSSAGPVLRGWRRWPMAVMLSNSVTMIGSGCIEPRYAARIVAATSGMYFRMIPARRGSITASIRVLWILRRNNLTVVRWMILRYELDGMKVFFAPDCHLAQYRKQILALVG